MSVVCGPGELSSVSVVCGPGELSSVSVVCLLAFLLSLLFIFHQGDEAERMYFIEYGEVRVMRTVSHQPFSVLQFSPHPT